jgi:hypothetical protein
MPWSSPPDDVKKRYSPRCAAVWVEVANAELAKSGDEGRAFRVANTAANQCKAAGKTMPELKAQLIDDNHFKLLAIPYGGQFDGRDFDGEFFTKRTDIKPDWFDQRPVLWHHGQDEHLGDRVIGQAVDLTEDEDGWWVDVWLRRGEKHAELVKQLSQKAPLYGSSGTIGYLKKSAPDGEILVWPYVEQTLTLAPSNILSVSRPAKALIETFTSADIAVSPAIKALLTELEQLRTDLQPTSTAREVAARDERMTAIERSFVDTLETLRRP